MKLLPEVAITVIRRRNGDFFVHRRRADKRVYPGHFGLGAGGTLEPGETPAEAARRELREETGLDAEPASRFAFTFEDRHRVHVFELLTRDEPRLDESEWDWAGWVDQDEVQRLKASEQLCPDTAMLLDRLLRAVDVDVEPWR